MHCTDRPPKKMEIGPFMLKKHDPPIREPPIKYPRCSSLMVHEKFYGSNSGSGSHEPCWGWRCIICGEIIDEVTLEHRKWMKVGRQSRVKREDVLREDIVKQTIHRHWIRFWKEVEQKGTSLRGVKLIPASTSTWG